MEKKLYQAREDDAAVVDELFGLCREPLRRAVDLRVDPNLVHGEDAGNVGPS